MKSTKIFTPLKPKTDTCRTVFLGLDGSCYTIWERRTELGTQEYAQVCTKLPNVDLSRHRCGITRELSHITLSEPGILRIPLATGRRVHLDLYENNSSENSRNRGITIHSLYVNVQGLGTTIINALPGIISGALHLAYDIEPQTAELLRAKHRHEFDSGIRVLTFEDHEEAKQDAA